MKITPNFMEIEKNALQQVQEVCSGAEEIALVNTAKVLRAFKKYQVADYYLKPSTGYAYADTGRDALDKVAAEVFGGEAALYRSQFVSGTHALAVALLGVLRNGDEIISLTGKPYDTMQTIIGTNGNVPGSLIDLGIKYSEVPFNGPTIDLQEIGASVNANTRLVMIQRSCGYSTERQSLSLAEIAEICATVKKSNPNCICFVDNCYGEFLSEKEPPAVGADLIAGSLIKNPGGGIAPTGGYIAGRKDLVELASYRLSAPGLGGKMGATLGDTSRLFYQGMFLAPHIVLQAVKTAVFAASVFTALGYQTFPGPHAARRDIIQAIKLGSADKLCQFCEAIQANSPVDAHVKPVPSPLPGYRDQIIMAAGTFVQGSSIELSADGPLREPYNVFLQGGLTFEHGRLAIMAAAETVGPAK